MLRRSFLLALSALVVASKSSHAQAANAQQFVQLAGSSGLFEVASSKLATERASRAEVKSFAQMMVKDHTAANEKLKAVAEKEGLQAPAEMTDKHASMY